MTIDNFSLFRGVIAGSIAVAGGAIHYKVWISPFIGISGGVTYGLFSIVMHKFKIDDPLEIFSAHAMPALVALIMTIFFDKKEGLFFKLEEEIKDEGSDEVMIIMGSNVLGIIMIVLWTTFFTLVFFAIIKRCLLRVSKTTEIVGSDVWQIALRLESLRNFLKITI